MAGFSDYLENEILDHIFGGADYPRPATVYIALFTAAPTDAAATGTECSGGSYARAAYTNSAGNFPAASGGSKSNAALITFPQATVSWGTVTHYAIFDDPAGGNKLAWGALSSSRTVAVGDTPQIAIGGLVITLD